MVDRISAVEVTVPRNAFLGWIADLKVSTKLLAAVLTMAVVALIIAILGVTRMTKLSDTLDEMRATHVESALYLGKVSDGVGLDWRAMLLHQVKNASADTTRQAADAAVSAAIASYQQTAKSSQARLTAVDQFMAAYQNFQNLRDVVSFGMAAPAGFTAPTVAQRGPVFQKAQKDMTDALTHLQSVERAESSRLASDARAQYRNARTLMYTALVVGVLLALGLVLPLSKSIKSQLRTVGEALDAVAEGDLTKAAEVRARDEIGVMAAAVNRARAGLRETVEDLTTGSRTLGSSARRLTEVTQRIGMSADETASQANAVATAAGEVSANVTTVAAGSEQMGASIREISRNANDAAQVAAEAVDVAAATNHTVAKLGDSSAEIGNVVKAITAIAEQTNLLALNATIEAARAGEAGKGFAVVASEVKDLAQETARATEDISRRVETIQADTASAVDAITRIADIIARINDYQLTIASAVEQQTATTTEMSRSVGDASGGTTNIAGTIGGVATAAQSTTTTLAEADATVAELARLADDLDRVVRRFTI
ncbi:methyl-accepting chemotaxis protein [Paractinoplanes globisporus]|uniref:Methyl-accepting chemotaxis protein n=1 Tax=Paractinoplanes globisporus TaxID=113565 RepID=A0ABW6WSC4_9ACTN|nr:methyl-accepting chemotaxis protein [Actinoplanes globisporus]